MSENSIISNLAKKTKNYCIYLPFYNLEYAMQINLLIENMKNKFKELNITVGVKKDILVKLKLNKPFISIEEMEEKRDEFAVCEKLLTSKQNTIEEYFIKNDIDLICNNEVPVSTNSEIVVFTETNNSKKCLGQEEINKIKMIFGHKIVLNPLNYIENPIGRMVIGPECWQIFYSASKKIPTMLITNKENYSQMFLKMFPKQKKIEL